MHTYFTKKTGTSANITQRKYPKQKVFRNTKLRNKKIAKSIKTTLKAQATQTSHTFTRYINSHVHSLTHVKCMSASTKQLKRHFRNALQQTTYQ